MAEEIITETQAKEREKEEEKARTSIELLPVSRKNGTGTGPIVDVSGSNKADVEIDVRRVWANADDAKMVVTIMAREDTTEDWQAVSSPKEFTKADKAKVSADLKDATEAQAAWEISGTDPTFEMHIVSTPAGSAKSGQ